MKRRRVADESDDEPRAGAADSSGDIDAAEDSAVSEELRRMYEPGGTEASMGHFIHSFQSARDIDFKNGEFILPAAGCQVLECDGGCYNCYPKISCKGCSFAVFGKSFACQEGWSCLTCHDDDDDGDGEWVMCTGCKDRCHQGHVVELAGTGGPMYCDCGAADCDLAASTLPSGETDPLADALFRLTEVLQQDRALEQEAGGTVHATADEKAAYGKDYGKAYIGGPPVKLLWLEDPLDTLKLNRSVWKMFVVRQRLAFASSMHSRLGSNSPLGRIGRRHDSGSDLHDAMLQYMLPVKLSVAAKESFAARDDKSLWQHIQGIPHLMLPNPPHGDTFAILIFNGVGEFGELGMAENATKMMGRIIEINSGADTGGSTTAGNTLWLDVLFPASGCLERLVGDKSWKRSVCLLSGMLVPLRAGHTIWLLDQEVSMEDEFAEFFSRLSTCIKKIFRKSDHELGINDATRQQLLKIIRAFHSITTGCNEVEEEIPESWVDLDAFLSRRHV